jgi:hypothetical protein
MLILEAANNVRLANILHSSCITTVSSFRQMLILNNKFIFKYRKQIGGLKLKASLYQKLGQQAVRFSQLAFTLWEQ